MNAGGFELIDHTADIGISVWGDTKEALFVAAAQGMCSLMYDTDNIKPQKEWTVSVDGDDDESLLISWLNELLYIYEIEDVLFSDFKIEKLSSSALTATAIGEPYSAERHQRKYSIKAATYHMLKVIKNDKWHVKIIFDI